MRIQITHAKTKYGVLNSYQPILLLLRDFFGLYTPSVGSVVEDCVVPRPLPPSIVDLVVQGLGTDV